MPLPTQDQCHLPILRHSAEFDVPLHRLHFAEYIAACFSLNDEERAERTPVKGTQRYIDRTNWALSLLKRAGLMDIRGKSQYQINDLGHQLLVDNPSVISKPYLDGLAEGLVTGTNTIELTSAGQVADLQEQASSPWEEIHQAWDRLNRQLTEDLLDSLASVPSERFEKLVLDLLQKMGYGEPEHTGKSGDGGIDGVINQDALGLEKVYVQAKRWAAQVGEPEIRNFSGSLDPFGATKGIFITTSSFSTTARQTAQTISAGAKFIRLIDGLELAQLMIRHGVGVVTEYTYEIKKVDENYFAEEI